MSLSFSQQSWTSRDGSQALVRSWKPLQDRGPRARSARTGVSMTREMGPPEGPSGAVLQEEGRLSNPMQRRLSEHDVDDLVSDYLDGSSTSALAALLNRTTIISHLDNRGAERRNAVRKMTDRSVRRAAKHY